MRGTEYLHPELQVIANKFLEKCKAAGLNVLITETYRTEAEQNALYAKGRTAPGNIVTNCKYPQSPHCWGVAFDFCRNVKGQEYTDSDGFFSKTGSVGKSLGLAWGGDWKGFVDKPHLELAKYLPNNSVKTLQAQYGTPEKFKAAWPKVVEQTKMEDEETMKRYQTIEEINQDMSWAVDTIKKLQNKGYLKSLDLTADMIRMFVVNDMAGLYD